MQVSTVDSQEPQLLGATPYMLNMCTERKHSWAQFANTINYIVCTASVYVASILYEYLDTWRPASNEIETICCVLCTITIAPITPPKQFDCYNNVVHFTLGPGGCYTICVAAASPSTPNQTVVQHLAGWCLHSRPANGLTNWLASEMARQGRLHFVFVFASLNKCELSKISKLLLNIPKHKVQAHIPSKYVVS